MSLVCRHRVKGLPVKDGNFVLTRSSNGLYITLTIGTAPHNELIPKHFNDAPEWLIACGTVTPHQMLFYSEPAYGPNCDLAELLRYNFEDINPDARNELEPFRNARVLDVRGKMIGTLGGLLPSPACPSPEYASTLTE